MKDISTTIYRASLPWKLQAASLSISGEESKTGTKKEETRQLAGIFSLTISEKIFRGQKRDVNISEKHAQS